jgi:hypothetical protein
MMRVRKPSKPSPARKQADFRPLQATAPAEIAKSLALSGNPRAMRVWEMMFDPAYARMSLPQLCSRAGISAGEVMRLFCQQQIADGMMRAARHLPDLMEGAALAARGRSEPCWKCRGKGEVNDSPCPDCRGTGEVPMLGDIRALRLVLKITGILP